MLVPLFLAWMLSMVLGLSIFTFWHSYFAEDPLVVIERLAACKSASV